MGSSTGSSGSVSAAASSGSESWSAIVGDGTPSRPRPEPAPGSGRRPAPRMAPADRLAVTSAPPSTSRRGPAPTPGEPYRAASASTRRPVSPAHPDGPAAVPGRPLGGRDPAVRGALVRWLPDVAVDRPDRRVGAAAPADARPAQGPQPALLARWHVAGLPLGSPAADRGGAGPHDRQERPRGPRAGPRPADRWTGRGAPGHRPAARCPFLRVVARRDAAGRRVELGRGTADEDRQRRGKRARRRRGPRHRRTTGSSTASTTCSTARASPTTR